MLKWGNAIARLDSWFGDTGIDILFQFQKLLFRRIKKFYFKTNWSWGFLIRKRLKLFTDENLDQVISGYN